MRLTRYLQRPIIYCWIFLYFFPGCSQERREIPDIDRLDSVVRASNFTLGDSIVFGRLTDTLCGPAGKENDLQKWSRHYLFYQYYFYQVKDLGKALREADTMVRLSIAAGGDKAENILYPKSLLSEGNVFLAQGLFTPAFEKIVRAREIMKANGDSCEWVSYTYSLATAAYDQRRYGDAVRILNQVLERQRVCLPYGSFQRLYHFQGDWDNIGICYVHLEEPDSAILYFDSALSVIRSGLEFFPGERRFFTTAEAVVLGNKGDACLQAGDSDQAEVLWKKSISVNRWPDHAPEDALINQLKLARLYLAQGRNTELRRLMDTVSFAADTIRNPDLSLDLLRLDYQYDSAIADWPAAAVKLRRFLRVQDSIDLIDLHRETVDLDTALAVIVNNAKLPLVERQNRFWISLIVILVVCLFLGAAVIFLILRQKRQALRNLENVHSNLLALEKSQEANSRILKVVAHDLRNPVASMQTMADMLQRKVVPEEKVEEFLHHMVVSGRDALKLMADLLEHQVTAIVCTKERVELKVMLEHCMMLLRHKSDAKQQEIILTGDSVAIHVDKEKLWRVFSNLLTNAVKFSPQGRKVFIRVEAFETNVVVSVRDEGIGIPAELREKIFTPASRRKGTAGEPTFGLGLMICQQIVELHKGRIWFESEVDKGTTFYVELPLA